MSVEKMDKFELFLEIGFDKEYSYRELFVRFSKEKKSSIVYVTNDGYGIGSFSTYSNNEDDFIKDCQEWAKNNI